VSFRDTVGRSAALAVAAPTSRLTKARSGTIGERLLDASTRIAAAPLPTLHRD
jgi:DNA-binding IclR family transcriptional regulator